MMKNKCLLLFFLMLMVLSSKVLAERNEICFYADSNYTGESICAAEGNEVKSIMKNWNDRISSISVPKGMTVLIYEGNNFSGRSMTLKSNIDFLSHPDLRYFN
ncbi:peptidase inhibitor family I36 protein, partial [Yersinia massiliensis]